MKKSNLIFTFAAVLLLLIPCLILGSEPAKAADVPVQERMISIDKQDQDFTQALETIADQAGITINIHGQTPTGKRDILLNEVSVKKAIIQIMRLYGVKSQAFAYDDKNNLLHGWILSSTSDSLSAMRGRKDITSVDDILDQSITLAELKKLEDDYSDGKIPGQPWEKSITLDEMEGLERDDSDGILPGLPEEESITREEMQLLEPDYSGGDLPGQLGEKGITLEEMKKLEPDDINEGTKSSITKEEMELLDPDI